MEINLTRRQALNWALVGTAALSGCCRLRPTIKPYCPASPAVSYLSGPLTIDAHCHVFNGSDLQISPFLSKVMIHEEGVVGRTVEALSDLLQNVSWTLSPRGGQELMALAELKTCEGTSALDSPVTLMQRPYDYGGAAALRQQAHSVGRAELLASLEKSQYFQTLQKNHAGTVQLKTLDITTQTQLAAIRTIRTIPEKVEDYIALQSDKTVSLMSTSEKSASGVIAFVLQNFQYRYVTVHDYLRTYNVPGKRVVDLMLPSMVDYDWWLAKGQSTQTSLPVQVQVMEQISILTGGRVHAFVPFDPLKQIAYELYGTGDDSLGLVKRAILSHGCVGVKLYPPMGFAALGNADVQKSKGADFWSRDWLPELTRRPDLGLRLDNAMRELFVWCVNEEVPVMAHTNHSNGVVPEFEDLAGVTYWAKALREFPGLRISFGHFGGADGEKGLDHAKAFAGLMSAAPGTPGQFAYADAGYFATVLDGDRQLLGTLQSLYDLTGSKGGAALANRFMYGTDWEMTLAHGNVGGYLLGWASLLDEIEQRPAIKQAGLAGLSEKFFGQNAADWIGLRKGGKSRNRLDAFYRANGIDQPDWVVKVDR
ncbi:amidohydrolase family protein [Pseudomonas kribbensis]|uniref:amidohydrolase family protein n=1 Tax=Pseudomonas kribbensis TaxID=1628086 RepID=UPI003D776905